MINNQGYNNNPKHRNPSISVTPKCQESKCGSYTRGGWAKPPWTNPPPPTNKPHHIKYYLGQNPTKDTLVSMFQVKIRERI